MANPGYFDPKKRKFVITSPNIKEEDALAALNKVAPAVSLDYQPVYTATNENKNVVHTGVTPYMQEQPAAKQPAPSYQPVRTDTTENTISDVMERMANWDQIMGTDPHQAGLDQLESAILDRKPFEYDLDTDPAWQAYKKQYTREGRRASEDVMGQYAAMTGGMPSTAAMTAASQAGDYYAAQMADKIPELYKLAYSMYADDAARQLSDLNAIRGLSGDWYNRQNDAYGRLGDLYSLASGERSYADSRADLAYNRAWNEDERDRARAKEDEANTIYGYGSDGSSYKITSQLGRDFISQARYGDPDMTGGDGSVWHKNEDGTITITRKDGRTYTVSGTPEEWNGLTLAQMWDAIDRANKTGTEIPPNVLKAWEHFMGGSYTGGAPAAGGGGYGFGGYAKSSAGGGKWADVESWVSMYGDKSAEDYIAEHYKELGYSTKSAAIAGWKNHLLESGAGEATMSTDTLRADGRRDSHDVMHGIRDDLGLDSVAGTGWGVAKESASGTGSNLSPAAQQIENTIASFAIGGSTADAQTYAADAIGDALDNGQISEAEADYLLKLFGF